MPNSLFETALFINKLSELELFCREMAIFYFVDKNLPGKLFLNISPKTLLNPSHPKGEILHLVENYGLNPNRFVIEVTENHKADDDLLFNNTIYHYR